jgi:predicted pyridoxine 5'-phosphate oxidase superfamily flavin-nucleotide-binding protein
MAAVELTDEMRDAFATAIPDGMVVIVATSGGSGMPDIAFKGSVMVWDTDHVAFWERALGTTFRNMQENPQVCLLYRNPGKRIAWKMFGEAQVLTEGDLRQQIMDRTVQIELDRDPERKGAAVLVRVDKVIALGQVIMERGT